MIHTYVHAYVYVYWESCCHFITAVIRLSIQTIHSYLNITVNMAFMFSIKMHHYYFVTLCRWMREWGHGRTQSTLNGSSHMCRWPDSLKHWPSTHRPIKWDIGRYSTGGVSWSFVATEIYCAFCSMTFCCSANQSIPSQGQRHHQILNHLEMFSMCCTRR